MKTVVIVILVALAVLLYFVLKTNSESPDIPDVCNTPDCKNKTTDCNVVNKLKTCETTEDCYSCFGNYECKYSDGSIETENGFLPKGNYCMPYEIQDITCNKFTGRKVLAKATDKDVYKWVCLCENDTQFTNKGNDSNCSGIRLCGMDGMTNEESKDRHLINKHTGKIWDASDESWDPTKDGVCSCGNNEVPNDTIFTCNSDSCYPGTKNGENSCLCPTGYINCSDVNYLGTGDERMSLGVCDPGTCILDSCSPGVWNNNTKHCECPAGTNNVPSINSATGEICIDWCKSSFNPCELRGKCTVNQTPDVDDGLDFTFIYVTDPKGWSIKSKTGYYLIYKNNVISSSNTSGSLFTITTQDKVEVTKLEDKGRYKLLFNNNEIYSWMFVNNKIMIDNLYLKVDSNGNVSKSVPILNTPSCTDCVPPFIQDESQQCMGKCFPSGLTTDNVSNCCSGKAKKDNVHHILECL